MANWNRGPVRNLLDPRGGVDQPWPQKYPLRAVLHLTQNISNTEHITAIRATAVTLKRAVPSARKHLMVDVSNLSGEPCCKMQKSACSLNPYSGLTTPPPPQIKARGYPHTMEPGDLGHQGNKDQKAFSLGGMAIMIQHEPFIEEEAYIHWEGPYVSVLFKARWWISGSLGQIEENPLLLVWGRTVHGLLMLPRCFSCSAVWSIVPLSGVLRVVFSQEGDIERQNKKSPEIFQSGIKALCRTFEIVEKHDIFYDP